MIARANDATMLVEAIKTRPRPTNDEWLASLNERKKSEIAFHDADRAEDADSQTGKGAEAANRKYYSAARLSDQYLDQWIASHVPGKIFLDYACGAGNMAIKAAQAGANLSIGMDISAVSVMRGKNTAERCGLSRNTLFIQGDCERTELPDECVDVVLCCGMLHHLDLSYAFPELRRILRPGGVILALEALSYNPLIKLYRALTPDMRTDWEKHHILSHADLRFAQRFFKLQNVRYWHLCSLLATPFRRTPLFDKALAVGDAMDSFLLRVKPISLMAWMFSFELVKDS